MDQTNPHVVSKLESLSAYATTTVCLQGLSELLLGIPTRRFLGLDLVSMKISSVISLALAGVSLWLLQRNHLDPRYRRAGRGCVLLVPLLGIATSSE